MTDDPKNPLSHLKAVLQRYPATPTGVNHVRAGRGTALTDWPEWCFLPMAAWSTIVSAEHRMPVLPFHHVSDVGRRAALGTWRYSQGVYQVDQEVFDALIASPLSGTIPSDVLYRLPEWCVYVETPALSWAGDHLYGFWAHLEWDVKTHRTELRFVFNCAHGLIPAPLYWCMDTPGGA